MRKIIFIILGTLAALVFIVFALRFLIGGSEDSWICENGQWIKHGNPSAEKPTTSCEVR